MTSVRTTITLDGATAEQARRLGVNVSAAARAGVEAALRTAMARADREAYLLHPEGDHDDNWDAAEAWTE